MHRRQLASAALAAANLGWPAGAPVWAAEFGWPQSGSAGRLIERPSGAKWEQRRPPGASLGRLVARTATNCGRPASQPGGRKKPARQAERAKKSRVLGL